MASWMFLRWYIDYEKSSRSPHGGACRRTKIITSKRTIDCYYPGWLLTGVYFQLTGGDKLFVAISFLIAFLAGGIPAAKGAFENLLQRKLDIDLLMVLAALAAAAVGEARDGAILLFLFSLAGTLEEYAMGNTKRAVVALMKLRPD